MCHSFWRRIGKIVRPHINGVHPQNVQGSLIKAGSRSGHTDRGERRGHTIAFVRTASSTQNVPLSPDVPFFSGTSKGKRARILL